MLLVVSSADDDDCAWMACTCPANVFNSSASCGDILRSVIRIETIYLRVLIFAHFERNLAK